MSECYDTFTFTNEDCTECNCEVRFTVHCNLSEGHEGKHKYISGYGHKPVTVTWEYEKQETCPVCHELYYSDELYNFGGLTRMCKECWARQTPKPRRVVKSYSTSGSA